MYLKLPRGGGYSSSSLNQAFKPLIASSLALALGVNVAMATDPSITYDNSGNGGGSAIAPNPTNSWQWSNESISNVVGTNSGKFLQLQGSGSSDIIKNLTITFDNLTDPNNTPTQSVDTNNSIKTLNIKVDGNISGNDAVLTFSNKNGASGKGIILGNSASDTDRGTLTFEFLGSSTASTSSNWNGNDNTKKRKIILDLSDTTTVGSKKSH